MPTMKYSGDRVADYNHGRRTGVLGKVVGPNLKGEWFVITEAHYDPDTDTTFATALQIAAPEVALEQLHAAKEDVR